MLKLATGTDFAQVNYKGNPQAATDVASGAVSMMFVDTAVARPFLQGGRLRALGMASAKRYEGLPDVPTLAEAGLPGLQMSGWLGFWFPAKTPRAIVDRFNAEVNAARAAPEIAQRMKEFGLVSDGVGPRPEDFAEFVRSEIALWARVVREAKIQPQ